MWCWIGLVRGIPFLVLFWLVVVTWCQASVSFIFYLFFKNHHVIRTSWNGRDIGVAKMKELTSECDN